MANILHGSRHRTFGVHNLGGRNYDYTEMYSPDKPGEEAKDNARVWYVYLDEAESHDADMIEGYRNILDSLLVFAALFSAVVTTFVAQTSQALQPDNGQITVSLLVENNHLLRAARNRTRIDAVPAASLGPESQTHTSIDVWVNGLFFTSLALSLSTALLSVLAKQWIQAYTATVSGDAKTRALIRQFRFGGLEKYKLGDIIQSLPLILHCSVAIFLVGLTLYVSQLSRPISGIVGVITALTFLFYFGSSMIPALDIACPYRIPFVFYSTKFLLYAAYTTGYTCQSLWYMLTRCLKPWQSWRPLWLPRQSLTLKIAEYNAVFKPQFSNNPLPHNSLQWVFNHSSNPFVKDIAIEGTCGLLRERSSRRPLPEYLDPNSGNSYFLSAIKYCLSRLPDTYSASSMEGEIGKSNKYGRLIKTFMEVFNLKNLLDKPTADFKDWQQQIRDALRGAYQAALGGRHRVLSRWLLELGSLNLSQSGSQWSMDFLHLCAYYGDAEDVHSLVHQGIDLYCRNIQGWTTLHHAAMVHNVDVAIALVKQKQSLLFLQTHYGETVLEIAIQFLVTPLTNQNNPSSDNSYMMVTYLLDHGAQLSNNYHNLYLAVFGILDTFYHHPGAIINSSYLEDPAKIKLLLDCGWNRTIQYCKGKTFLDFARNMHNNTLVEYLENYQTVRFAPYEMTSHTVNKETL